MGVFSALQKKSKAALKRRASSFTLNMIKTREVRDTLKSELQKIDEEGSMASDSRKLGSMREQLKAGFGVPKDDAEDGGADDKRSIRFSNEVRVEKYDRPHDTKKGKDRQGRSIEYLREVRFFEAIEKWCDMDNDLDEVFDGKLVEAFLTPKRTKAANKRGILTFDELADACELFVDERMYPPTLEEVDDVAYGVQTEEILTSLVRDFLESLFDYDIRQKDDQYALCHNCFHVSRCIILRRHALVEQGETESPDSRISVEVRESNHSSADLRKALREDSRLGSMDSDGSIAETKEN